MSDERKYAGADALGDDTNTTEVELPMLGSWVTVRFLETAEVARLALLPDLVDFVGIVAKMQATPDKLDHDDQARFVAESFRYSAHVAHLAVAHPEADDQSQRCDSCGFDHPQSLWTVKQASRLQPADMETITSAALRGQSQGLASVRPFSRARTQRASRTRARTSA